MIRDAVGGQFRDLAPKWWNGTAFVAPRQVRVYSKSEGRFVAVWPPTPESPALAGISAPVFDTPTNTYSLSLSWGTVDWAETYEVQQRSDLNSTWVTIASGLATTTLAVSGLEPAVTYEYRVRGIDDDTGVNGLWSNTRIATTGSTGLPGPTLTVTEPTFDAVANRFTSTASWSTLLAADTYELQQRVNGGSWATIQNTASLTANLVNLLASTAYDYRVRGVSIEAGPGAWSATRTIQTASTGLGTPTITATAPVYAAATNSFSTDLTWTGLPSAASYELQQATGSGSFAAIAWSPVNPLATPDAPTVVGSTSGGSLSAGTYSYRVAAVNAYGETLASVAATGNVASGITGSVSITMPNVSGMTGWKVYGRTAGFELLLATNGMSLTWIDTGVVTPNGSLPAANTTGARTKSITSLAPETSYQFRVRGVSASNEFGPWGTVTVSTGANGLGGPTLSAGAQSFTQSTDRWSVPLTWSDPPAADSFQLEEQVNGGTWTQVYAGTGTNTTRTGLLPNTSYGYRARAVSNNAGNGAWSATTQVRTGSSQLDLFNALTITVDAPTFNTGADRYTTTVRWTEPQYASTYEVERRTVNGAGTSAWTAVGSTGSATINVTGLEGQTVHEFRARASSSFGVGNWCATKQIATGLQKVPALTAGTPYWSGETYVVPINYTPPPVGAGGVAPNGSIPITSAYVHVLSGATIVGSGQISGPSSAKVVQVGVPGLPGSATYGYRVDVNCGTAVASQSSATLNVAHPALPVPGQVVVGAYQDLTVYRTNAFRNGQYHAEWLHNASGITPTDYKLEVFAHPSNALITTIYTSGYTPADTPAITPMYAGSGRRHAADIPASYSHLQSYYVKITPRNSQGYEGTPATTVPIRYVDSLGAGSVNPVSSNTWRAQGSVGGAGAWRNDVRLYAGVDGYGGHNIGCYFYDTNIINLLSPNANGYRVTITSLVFKYARGTNYSNGAQVSFNLHGGFDQNGFSAGSMAGGFLKSEPLGAVDEVSLPAHWGQYLADNDTYRGICLYGNPSSIDPGHGSDYNYTDAFLAMTERPGLSGYVGQLVFTWV